MKRMKEWVLLGGGAVLAAALAGGGEPVRGAIVMALGGVGAAVVSRLGRRPPRWPRLRKALGRRALAGCDKRLEGNARMDATLDAAEDALTALASDGARFPAALGSVHSGILDLTRRALGLERVRIGHEATLAQLEMEPRAGALEASARTQLAHVRAELEQIRGVLATVGPSVRHLGLVTHAEALDHGAAPAELEERLALLRQALTEELAHA